MKNLVYCLSVGVFLLSLNEQSSAMKIFNAKDSITKFRENTSISSDLAGIFLPIDFQSSCSNDLRIRLFQLTKNLSWVKDQENIIDMYANIIVDYYEQDINIIWKLLEDNRLICHKILVQWEKISSAVVEYAVKYAVRYRITYLQEEKSHEKAIEEAGKIKTNDINRILFDWITILTMNGVDLNDYKNKSAEIYNKRKEEIKKFTELLETKGL